MDTPKLVFNLRLSQILTPPMRQLEYLFQFHLAVFDQAPYPDRYLCLRSLSVILPSTSPFPTIGSVLASCQTHLSTTHWTHAPLLVEALFWWPNTSGGVCLPVLVWIRRFSLIVN